MLYRSRKNHCLPFSHYNRPFLKTIYIRKLYYGTLFIGLRIVYKQKYLSGIVHVQNPVILMITDPPPALHLTVIP